MLIQTEPLWSLDAFEPVISSETMMIHVYQLHQAYIKKLDQKFRHTDLLEIPPSEVLSNLTSYLGDRDREFYRNQMGGHVCHSLFWQVITPHPIIPSQDEGLEILEDFGLTPEVLKETIIEEANKRFGSVVVASEDFYILGILTSQVHRQWVKVQSSTLEDRTCYTHNTCFETFPFPQNPQAELIEQIRAATYNLHDYRTEQMEKKQWGITQLYNKFFNQPSSQLYKFHTKLDQLVMQVYGFSPNDDILERLLKLNLELAQKEKQLQFRINK